jgi:hypothetical protein
MSARYVVVCDDYTSRPFPTRDAAEHWLAGVQKLDACHCDHLIQEVIS